MSAIAPAPGASWAVLPQFSRGTLAGLKWLGLALMTLDHLDAFVYGRELTWAGQLGRLVFPIFALVMAYNLARPEALQRGVYGRLLRRLLVFGLIAQPAHGWLTAAAWGVWPLNILATFAVFVGCAWLIERGQGALSGALFVAGGALVEYAWPGVAVCLALWQLYRDPSAFALVLVGASFASLELVNSSQAAWWALPLLLLASRLQLELPRSKWLFWAYYPTHLVAFALPVAPW